MTGSIQLKKGHWYTVINTKDASGKTKQKWEITGLKEKGNTKRAEKFCGNVSQSMRKEAA